MREAFQEMIRPFEESREDSGRHNSRQKRLEDKKDRRGNREQHQKEEENIE
jgi:hypothetical protein